MLNHIKEVTNNNFALEILEYTRDHSLKLYALIKTLYGESDYFLYEEKDLPKNVGDFESDMRRFTDTNSFILIAKIDEVVVGFLAVSTEQADKKEHIAKIILGILKAHWKQGICRTIIRQS